MELRWQDRLATLDRDTLSRLSFLSQPKTRGDAFNAQQLNRALPSLPFNSSNSLRDLALLGLVERSSWSGFSATQLARDLWNSGMLPHPPATTWVEPRFKVCSDTLLGAKIAAPYAAKLSCLPYAHKSFEREIDAASLLEYHHQYEDGTRRTVKSGLPTSFALVREMALSHAEFSKEKDIEYYQASREKSGVGGKCRGISHDPQSRAGFILKGFKDHCLAILKEISKERPLRIREDGAGAGLVATHYLPEIFELLDCAIESVTLSDIVSEFYRVEFEEGWHVFISNNSKADTLEILGVLPGLDQPKESAEYYYYEPVLERAVAFFDRLAKTESDEVIAGDRWSAFCPSLVRSARIDNRLRLSQHDVATALPISEQADLTIISHVLLSTYYSDAEIIRNLASVARNTREGGFVLMTGSRSSGISMSPIISVYQRRGETLKLIGGEGWPLKGNFINQIALLDDVRKN